MGGQESIKLYSYLKIGVIFKTVGNILLNCFPTKQALSTVIILMLARYISLLPHITIPTIPLTSHAG